MSEMREDKFYGEIGDIAETTRSHNTMQSTVPSNKPKMDLVSYKGFPLT